MSTMTRQHFELIASVLKYNMPSIIANPKGYEDRLYTWTNIVNQFAHELVETNPNSTTTSS